MQSQIPVSHPDPEEEAVEDYDRPPPPPPPHQPRERSPERAEPASSSRGFANAVSSGANGTLAGMTAAAAHGISYGATAAAHGLAHVATAATVGVIKGTFSGFGHYATGENPYGVVSGGEESARETSVEPMRAFPKAKAQSRSSSSGWWAFPGKQKSPEEAPKRKFVDAAPWNGTGQHAIDLTGDDVPAAQEFYIGDEAARRPRGRPIAQRDVRLAQESLAADRNLPHKRGGR